MRCGHLPQPPVMLVHGLGADRSCFSVMEEYLHDARVHRLQRELLLRGLRYPCVCQKSGARSRLAHRGDRIREPVRRGAQSRWRRPPLGLDAHPNARLADIGVTLGSPHFGTPTAHLAPARLPGFGRIVSQLRPGAHLTTDFDDQRGVRWVAIAGASDLVVPPKYACLPRATNVRNVLVPWCGHLTLTHNRQCLDIILEELEAAGGMASTMCAIGESATSGSSHPRSQCA